MRPYWTDLPATASSLHQEGLKVRRALDLARQQVSSLLGGVTPEEILFTSSGTEALNEAIKGFATTSPKRHLVLSAIEHPAIESIVQFLETQGFTATRLPVDPEGFLHPQQIQEAFRDDTLALILHLGHHDLGTIQPIEALTVSAHERKIPVILDACHAAGWIPIQVKRWGIAALALSAHRFHGPKGAGALYLKKEFKFPPRIHGGNQENGRRGGTENIPGIIGLGKAAELAHTEMTERLTRVTGLQKRLAEGLLKLPKSRRMGPPPGPQRLPQHLHLQFFAVEGEALTLLADLQQIALGAVTSCITGPLRISPALKALGFNETEALSSVILGVHALSTPEEIDYTLTTLPKLIDRLRNMSPRWKEAAT